MCSKKNQEQAMKKYSRLLLGIFFIISSILLTQCDSPLSDEPLNDPSKISPTLSVERTLDNTKTTTGEAIAFLFDKNLNLVKIMDGGVSVNGTNLTLEYLITGGPYYETSGNYPIFLNTNYTITVTMSNGDTYDSTIRTQFQELHTFNIPATFNHTDSVQVTWEEVIQDYPMSIEFSYDDGDDVGVVYVDIPEDSVDTGSYTIPPDNFTELAGKTCKAKLISEKQGAANEHFKETASISSKIAIIEECHIN